MAALPFWHIPHTLRGPIGSSIESPSGRVRIAAPPHPGTPLRRFVAPDGAPPKAPVAGFAWRCHPVGAHPSHA
eukprot:6454619-Pyramimonas_sp.AAC.1